MTLTLLTRQTPHTGGRFTTAPLGAVLHVAEGSEASVDSWFANPVSKVSAHFLVGLDGEIRQYVPLDTIAYHAGVVDRPTWPWLRAGVSPNRYLLGIEHEGSGQTPWPEAQLTASALLSAWLCRRFGWTATQRHFPLHREIRASKTCPGPAFVRAAYLGRVHAALDLLPSDMLGDLFCDVR